ncbi:hypothetical protein ACLB2K_050283 [Fragaria x ananassa]
MTDRYEQAGGDSYPFLGSLQVMESEREAIGPRRESCCFVFQFKSKAERDRIVGGGSWSFNGGMLILAKYDELSPVEAVSLNHLEVWVSIARLHFSMRNNKVLSCVANALGVLLRANPGPIQRKEKIQRVRDCGFFGHGGGTCDKGLICGLPVVDVVSAVDGEVELLASQSMEAVGLVKEPVL